MTDDLVKRMKATLDLDAINGDLMERIIVEQQFREAADRIDNQEFIIKSKQSLIDNLESRIEECQMRGKCRIPPELLE